jgi:geranylgeranyl reductase family protein
MVRRKGGALSSKPDHDAIIVGAGVAGCRAALTLARSGVRVLLMDRSGFPRWKPCAGGLTLKARPYLEGPLWDEVQVATRGASLALGTEYLTHLRSDGPLGWMVHRESFDHAHLRLAAAQPGVEVVLGRKVLGVREHSFGVTVETEAGVLEAAVAVGADGARSVVSRALPGHCERRMGFAYEGEARPVGPASSDEAYFDFAAFPGGYGWVFPKADHCSLGGFVYEQSQPAIKDLYQAFLRNTPGLRGSTPYRARGHPVSLGGSLRKLNSTRVLLAGEAGDLVDPLTGEGIHYALRSGQLAAEAIARFLGDGTPLDSYSAVVRAEIQEDLRYGRLLADFFYRNPRLSYHLFFRNSLACRWLAEVRAGLRGYRDLARMALIKGITLPFHAGVSRRREVRLRLPGSVA